MNEVFDIEEILEGRSIEEIMLETQEEKGLDRYTLGKQEFTSREEFDKELSLCKFPRGGVLKKEIIIPQRTEKMTEEEHLTLAKLKLRKIQTYTEFPVGDMILRDPKLIDIVVSKHFGTNYNKKNPVIKEPYEYLSYVFAITCRLKHRGQKTLSDSFDYKFFMIGNNGMEIAEAIRSGDPMVISHSVQFKNGSNRDVFSILTLEDGDL